METIHTTSDANRTVEFYLPGTFQFSREPGRIERFLGRILRNRDAAELPTVDAGGREFYLPGTPSPGPGAR